MSDINILNDFDSDLRGSFLTALSKRALKLANEGKDKNF